MESFTAVEQNSWHVGFPVSCSALPPWKATPRLLARFHDFKRPEHAPRSPPGTQSCAVVYRWAPSVPRSRERVKRPKGGGVKRAKVQKKIALVHGKVFSNSHALIHIASLCCEGKLFATPPPPLLLAFYHTTAALTHCPKFRPWSQERG